MLNATPATLDQTLDMSDAYTSVRSGPPPQRDASQARPTRRACRFRRKRRGYTCAPPVDVEEMRMRRGRIESWTARALPVSALLLAAMSSAAPARAVEPYLMSVGVLGGVGGALDADSPDPGVSQRLLQLEVGLFTEPRTLLQARLGRLTFGNGDQLGDLLAPELEYLTIAGEYRFYQSWYDSGLFIGLGAYRLSGDRQAGGRNIEETRVGLTAGATAEFELTHHLSVLTELSGHYVDFHESQLFATAQAGLSCKF